MFADFQEVRNATYREQAPKVQSGIPVFSPLCNPQFQNAAKQNEYKEDLRWGAPTVSVEPVPPVAPRRLTQFDDSPSASGFSSDPTYAERARSFPRTILPADVGAPALALYHKLKRLEFEAFGLFQGQQALEKRMQHIKPRDAGW
jgi:hypothetical protein